MFKNLSGLAQLMRSASSLKERVKEMRASLAAETATGSAAGDQVRVEVSGVGVVTRLQLAPELIASNDVSLIEELIPAALNEALAKVRQMHVDKVREATGGIELPGLSDALAEL